MTGGAVLPRPHAQPRSPRSTRSSPPAIGHRTQNRADHRSLRGRCHRVPAARRRPLGVLVPEARSVRRRLLAARRSPRRGAVAPCRSRRTSAAASRSASPSPGPGSRRTRGQVEFQLACPKRFVVGGLDAELSSRGIEIGFVGSLGSPVNPGITTSAAAVFLGRLVRGQDPARELPPAHRLHTGSGGGQRARPRTTPSRPAKPTVRQREDRSTFGRRDAHYVGSCPRTSGSLLATHAVAFYGERRRPRALAARPASPQRCVARRRRPTSRATRRAIAGARAVVQLDLALRGRDDVRPPASAADAARDPARARLYRLCERRRMRYAVRYTNVDVLAAVVADRTSVAALARDRRVPARARDALRRRRAAARAPAGRERQCDGRARARRLRLDAGAGRQADAAHGGADGDAHVPRQGAAARSRSGSSSSPARRRSRRRRRPITSSSPQAVDARRLLPRLRRHRDRRCDRARRAGRASLGRVSELGVERCSATDAPRRVHDRGRPGGEHARLDSLPLRRPPDTRACCRRSQGAAKARAAGIPVYTVSLGTTGNTTLRGFPGGGRSAAEPAAASGSASAPRGLAPDPKTLKAIATTDRRQVLPRAARRCGPGRVLEARLQARPDSPARIEVTDWFLARRRRAARPRGRAVGALGAQGPLKRYAFQGRGMLCSAERAAAEPPRSSLP